MSNEVREALPSLGELTPEEVKVLELVRERYLERKGSVYLCHQLQQLGAGFRYSVCKSLLGRIDVALTGYGLISGTSLSRYLSSALNDRRWLDISTLNAIAVRIAWIDKILEEQCND